MTGKITLRWSWWLWTVLVVCSVYVLFQWHFAYINREVDRRISHVIEDVHSRIPPEFFDVAVSQDSITPQEYHQWRDVLFNLAETHTIAHLYTLVEIDGRYYFTLLNELKPYFTEYDPVADTRPELFETSQDGISRWSGKSKASRTCISRFVTPLGQHYLIGADVLFSDIDAKYWLFLTQNIPTSKPLIVLNVVFLIFQGFLTVVMLYRRQKVLCFCTWIMLLCALGFGNAQITEGDTIQTQMWTQSLMDMTRIFAEQTQKMGHAEIQNPLSDNPEGERAYQEILAAHTAWCKDTNLLLYVYTCRLMGDLEDQKMEFIMSCPSDANGDGKIDLDTELGNPPFTPYYDDSEETVFAWENAFELAFQGVTSFDTAEPSPLYGVMLTCATPLYDKNGQVEAILATDFDIMKWDTMSRSLRWKSLILFGLACSSILIIAVFLLELLTVLHRTRHINRDLVDRTNRLIWSESKMQAVLAGNTAIVFYGPDGMIDNVNSAMERLLGYQSEDIVGRTLLEFCDQETSKTGWNIQMIPDDCDELRMDIPFLHKNGQTVWVDMTITAMRDASESVVQIVALCVDVTSERNLMQNLEAAKNEAISASKTKSDFLATMSHEIRTPLNGVIGLSDLLLGTDLNFKQLEYAQLIKISGESLLYLINDILDFSKIEAGKLEISSEEFDLVDTVEASLAILAARAKTKNLTLGTAFGGHLPRTFMGDAGRVRQILLNLIGNAIKFTETGGVLVVVTPEEWLGDQLTLYFAITDTGIGIPGNRMDRLFKTFSQTDSTSSRIYGGTGLGLAISKRLVQLMGGDIGVLSTHGKGSTFWFRLPFLCPPGTGECITQKQFYCKTQGSLSCVLSKSNCCAGVAHIGQKAGFTLDDKRVLIVSLNNIVRISLSQQLGVWKMRVSEATSGEEMLELLQQGELSHQPFSIIFIDEQLKDGKGKEWGQKICDNPAWNKIAVTLLTPFTGMVESEEPVHSNIRYLAKPVFYSALFDMVMIQLYDKEWSRFVTEYSPEIPVTSSLAKRHGGKGEPATTRFGDSQRAIRILVAEDNRVNQIVIKNILQECGVDCILAINGREAVDIAMTQSLDLVLMDCQMPETDGYDATLLIRNWEREQGKKHLPIIALTANATQDDAQKCFEVGMNAFCSKPIDAKKLIEEIQKWLK